jgi:hypothetical protein
VLFFISAASFSLFLLRQREEMAAEETVASQIKKILNFLIK